MKFLHSIVPLCIFVVSFFDSPFAAAGTRLEVDPTKSDILAVARRDGVLSFLAHDHAILATKWTTDVCLHSDTRAKVKVRVETNSLLIDTSDALAKANVESKISSSDRNSLQQKLMSARFLNAAQFPVISFESSSVQKQSASQWIMTGQFNLHGVSHPISVQIQQQGERLAGTFQIKQSDYGIEPESIAGVVKVKDEIEIRFNLAVKNSKIACS